MSFDSYGEFFPFYVAAHSRRVTRWLHASGTVLGVLTAVFALTAGRWYLVALAPIVGYAFAWYAHFVIEKNKPATFGHPLYSLRGDWHMLALMLTGRDRRLDLMARVWLAAHPAPSARPDASASMPGTP